MKCKVELLRFLWLSYLLYLTFCNLCKDHQYTVEKDGGTYCQNCGECHAAFGRYPPCGSRVDYPVVSECKQCLKGYFSDKDDTAPCKKCHQCVKHEKVLMQCTNKSDTKCSGECDNGYYFTKGVPHNCQKCSYCCFDGKDVVQTECVKKGLNATAQNCSVRLDKHCGPTAIPTSGTQASDEGGSNKTLHIILGVLGAIALIAILLVAMLLWVQRRKKYGRQRTSHKEECNNTQVVELTQTAEHVSPDGGQISSVGQQVAQSSKGVMNFVCNTSQPGTPQISSVKTMDSYDKENNLPSPAGINGNGKLKRQISQDSQSSKDGNGKLKRQISQDSQSSKAENGKIKRQISQDSQSSKDGRAKIKQQKSQDSQSSKGESEYAFRKRSRSSSIVGSIEEKTMKFSLKKEDSLLSNDEDEESSVPAPQIKEHPKSQSVKQGDRVEFTCNVKKERKKTVFYQWLKDETELEGKRHFSLVLDSVKMIDFGSYKCRVKYEHGESEESSAAELDVKPGAGKEYKLLMNLDLDTQDKICRLLRLKTYGVGHYTRVAELYGMEKIDIEVLQESTEPGTEVIQYLRASHPELTVYNFCKDLKRIKRLDIVRTLESHFVSEANSAIVC